MRRGATAPAGAVVVYRVVHNHANGADPGVVHCVHVDSRGAVVEHRDERAILQDKMHSEVGRMGGVMSPEAVVLLGT